MTGLREKKKVESRKRITNAAARLIRKRKSTDFTMAELAKLAGISTYTTYNLIGSKAGVLYILLNDILDQIILPDTSYVSKKIEAIEKFFEIVDVPLKIFTDQEDFYRALTRFLFSSSGEPEREKYQIRAWGYWRQAIAVLDRVGLLPADIRPSDLIRAANLSFTGVIEVWTHGELSSEGMRAQVRSVLAMLLLSLGDAEVRRLLLDIVNAERAKVEASLWPPAI